MISYLHDGSIDGRLCALKAALYHAKTPENISQKNGSQESLFSDDITVKTDEKVAKTLLARIKSDISKQALHHVMYALLSEELEFDLSLYFYLSEGFIRGSEVDMWHANKHVKSVHALSRKVGHEIHRYKGLLRFRELEDGTLWAPFEPTYQILLPLAYHFRRRLDGESGILQDMKRGVAISWTNSFVDYINPPKNRQISNSEEETQKLWQTYFKSVTISERINTRAQRQFMPTRYWKYLTEQIDNLAG